jgi:hypothetical protein
VRAEKGNIARCLFTKGYVASIPGHVRKFPLWIMDGSLVGEKLGRLVRGEMNYGSKSVEGKETAIYRLNSSEDLSSADLSRGERYLQMLVVTINVFRQ